jgi:hypothetical protein
MEEPTVTPVPDKPSNVTTVVIEMEPGWVYVKVADRKPHPSRTEFFLRRAIEEWFADRPTLSITKATAITNHGEMLGIHVWYDVDDRRLDPTQNAGPVEFGIDVHREIASRHSTEYVEAVITDALRILPTYRHRNDTLIVINPRRLAVVLDKQARRGAVIPGEFVKQAIEGPMKYVAGQGSFSGPRCAKN